MTHGDKYIQFSIKAAELAQGKYKKVKIEEPWPDWEKANEQARQEFILFLRELK